MIHNEQLALFDSVNKNFLSNMLTDIANYTGYEAGGLYIPGKETKFFENIAEDKENLLSFKSIDWDSIKREKKNHPNAILFHSHVKESQDWRLSYYDISLARDINLPIVCYHTEFKKWDFYSPFVAHPYPLRLHKGSSPKNKDWFLGWEYSPGRADCYSIVEYYYQSIGIKLPVLMRSENDFNDLRSESWNRFLLEYTSNNFRILNNECPKVGDVLLFRLAGARFPNHCGIFIEEGKILHLLGGKRLSEIIDISYYRNAIAGIFRYDATKQINSRTA